MTEEMVGIKRGVYLSNAGMAQVERDGDRAYPIHRKKDVPRGRTSCIVTRVDKDYVQIVVMRDTGIEVEWHGHEDFVEEFGLALPNYPVRRAARVYMKSFITKTDESAAELLRLLFS